MATLQCGNAPGKRNSRSETNSADSRDELGKKMKRQLNAAPPFLEKEMKVKLINKYTHATFRNVK